MVAQFTSGDIGEGDHQREAEIVKAMRRYRRSHRSSAATTTHLKPCGRCPRWCLMRS